MGHKAQKRLRKTLQFYRVHYQLTKPFNVVCDGTVLHYAQQNSIFLKQAMARLLVASDASSHNGRGNAAEGAGVFLTTTKCVVHELRALGTDFKAAASFAKRLQHETCAHHHDGDTTPELASKCLLELVRAANKRHEGIVVASNDRVLIDKLQRFPNVMLVFCVNQTLQLSRPSTSAKEKVAQNESGKVDGRSALRRELEHGELPVGSDTVASILRSGAARFEKKQKKKRKGPNPLSVKKKQPKPVGLHPVRSETDSGAIVKKSKRVRRRK
ncbi:rRNA-processing protein UTP23-like [Porphyridium purpureum]|uniref:rRNA-processing protein UTP23-like n=1 Tax=Porphyridium purpureum TaxID=35688 RepID=A0A5J4YQU9_PORPP|nr:rRNA-processing protein UTP23-like [Porphyridium purpureum]|eukprot:POR4284..scf296_7